MLVNFVWFLFYIGLPLPLPIPPGIPPPIWSAPWPDLEYFVLGFACFNENCKSINRPGILDRLVHTEQKTRCLRGSSDGVGFHDCWFPGAGNMNRGWASAGAVKPQQMVKKSGMQDLTRRRLHSCQQCPRS